MGLILITGMGYGDIYPVTPEGKVVGGLLSFVGVIVAVLPIGAIAAGREMELKEERRRENIRKMRNIILFKRP